MSSEQDQNAFLMAMLRMWRPGGHIQFQGMTRGEYFMLNVLSEHQTRVPGTKGMYVSELVEFLRVSPPAVSRMLRSLERKEYVKRVVDTENRRTTYIQLLPEGERARFEMEGRVMAFARRVTQRLGPEDTATMIRLWQKMGDIVQEEEQAMV